MGDKSPKDKNRKQKQQKAKKQKGAHSPPMDGAPANDDKVGKKG